MSPAVTCDAARELLTAHLDGELAGSERAAVEAHLAGCAACRSRAESLRAAIGALAALPAIEPSARFEAAVLEAVSLQRVRRPRWARRVAVVLIASGAVAAALLFALPRPSRALPASPTELAVAVDLELFEDYDAVQVSDALHSAEDVAVVAELDQLVPVAGQGGERR